MVAEGLHRSMGGQAVSITNLVNALLKKDCSLKLLVGHNGNSDISCENLFSDNKLTHFRYFTKFKFSPSLFFSLFRLRNEFDILHCNGIWNSISLVCLLFCQIFKKKLVLSPRGMATKESINRSNLRKLYFSLTQIPILNRCSFVHITSSKEKDDLISKGIQSNFVLATNGIQDFSPVRFHDVAALRKSSKKICFVGRICSYKNVDLLVDAFSELDSSFNEWSLSIAGPIEDKSLFQTITSSSSYKKNKDRIIFLGQLNNNELYDLYLESSFLVCCSNSENFGLSIAEGLYFGIPAVCPNQSPWSLINADHFYPIDPDKKSLIKGLKYFIEGYSYDFSNFESCKQLASEYTWEKQASLLLDEYHKLI